MEDVIDFCDASLEMLVNFKEVLDFCDHHGSDVCNIVDLVVIGVFGWDSDYFDIIFSVVDHFHGSYRPRFYDNSWGDGNAGEDDDVKRVAIIPKCLRNKSIVSWIMERAIENSVEFDEL